MRDELFKGLSDEQIKKVRECNNSEEILAIAKAEGIELNDEQLEAVSGGGCEGQPIEGMTCDKCGSNNITIMTFNEPDGVVMKRYRCADCARIWRVRE